MLILDLDRVMEKGKGLSSFVYKTRKCHCAGVWDNILEGIVAGMVFHDEDNSVSAGFCFGWKAEEVGVILLGLVFVVGRVTDCAVMN